MKTVTNKLIIIIFITFPASEFINKKKTYKRVLFTY